MKRIFDLLTSFLILIFVCPFLILLCIFVFMCLGRPIFFTQLRPGVGGKIFKMYKFSSMRDIRNSHGDLLADAERLTRFGRILRSYSLDELPALWNVLIGDMSLVGPRPLLAQYLPLYSSEQARRHDVRPGITGWAQVNGRNAISWEQKFELDVWYVDNRSMALDIKILCLTVKKVLVREGISAAGEATMPRFEGSVQNNDKNGH